MCGAINRAPGGRTPRLDAIGGAGWRQARARAAARARETAAEYLRLAAERAAAPGIANPHDGAGHREFAEAFPCEETPDQRAAIEEIRADMEAPHPMDRLLCGDVGYGKTEVAARALFKAVAGGRQAALVAPTAVLAEQHADLLASRFAPFGVPVAALTGATAREEGAAWLARLAAGEPLVAVGTHRLLGAGVRFGALGLVVVDEEQRFGAGHKERARALAPGVDLLTLTATPIPPTLHLALGGLRSLSALETPPEERLAVRPLVAPFSWELVREALGRELARGGQAFFVHNRIETIARVGTVLRGMLPGRRIGLAHARLPAAALEATMRAFRAGEVDVLRQTGQFGNKTGCSMASPHVAGAIGYLFSVADEAFMEAYHNDPAGMALVIKQCILEGVDTIPSLIGKTVTGGRLNIYKAAMLMPDLQLSVSILADNETICEGENVQLSAQVIGGTGNLTYPGLLIRRGSLLPIRW